MYVFKIKTCQFNCHDNAFAFSKKVKQNSTTMTRSTKARVSIGKIHVGNLRGTRRVARFSSVKVAIFFVFVFVFVRWRLSLEITVSTWTTITKWATYAF